MLLLPELARKSVGEIYFLLYAVVPILANVTLATRVAVIYSKVFRHHL